MAKSTRGVRAVAAFEFVKGLIVLLAAGLLARVLHSGTQDAIEDLARRFHMNPARDYPRVFLETLAHFGNAHLLALSFGALTYATIRFIEAYGLWHARSWAWGFGIISAALYIPLEVEHLVRSLRWTGLAVLAANLLIVIVLWRNRKTVD